MTSNKNNQRKFNIKIQLMNKLTTLTNTKKVLRNIINKNKKTKKNKNRLNKKKNKKKKKI